jgi:hypothetical protein
MPPVGFNPTIPAGDLPHTYALDRAATGTGLYVFTSINSAYIENTLTVDTRDLFNISQVFE